MIMMLIPVVKYLTKHVLSTKQVSKQSGMTEGEVQFLTIIVPKMPSICLNKRIQQHTLEAICEVKRERGLE